MILVTCYMKSVGVTPGIPVHLCRDESLQPLAFDPASHSCDQRRSLPTSILGLLERHLTLRRQFLQRLLHDAGET